MRARRLQLTINTPYFPGWTIALDGRTIPAAVQSESGFMQVTIPAGRHRVDARLTDTSIRRLANILSAFSLAILAAFTAWSITARFRRGPDVGKIVDAERGRQLFVPISGS